MDDMVPTKFSKDAYRLTHIVKQKKERYCAQINQINTPKVEKLLRSIVKDWIHGVDIVATILNQLREEPHFNSFFSE